MIHLIGIDCAVQNRNIGLAFGTLDDVFRLESVMQGSKTISIEEQLIDWIQLDRPVLIALDAPLGWPESLGTALPHHKAGEPIDVSPDQLFSRDTDQFVWKKIGKKPLDVGAARIARTAHATLRLIDTLRNRSGQPIPLVWHPDHIEGVQIIEVYPAATLKAHNLISKGYKKSDQVPTRGKIYRQLTQGWESAVEEEVAVRTGHVFDAVVCVKAALDFLEGTCYSPPDSHLAQKEGWIWVRK